MNLLKTPADAAKAHIAVELVLEDEAWEAACGGAEALERLAQGCAAAVVAEMLDSEPDFDLDDGAEVNLLFCDDARIKELNRDFRGKDKPTNVLSFPGPETFDGPVALGDIALARETILREAVEQAKTAENHLRHMIVHGVLHLLGFDHEEDDEAEEMEAMEIAILARLGVENPFLTMEESEKSDHERL